MIGNQGQKFVKSYTAKKISRVESIEELVGAVKVIFSFITSDTAYIRQLRTMAFLPRQPICRAYTLLPLSTSARRPSLFF